MKQSHFKASIIAVISLIIFVMMRAESLSSFEKPHNVEGDESLSVTISAIVNFTSKSDIRMAEEVNDLFCLIKKLAEVTKNTPVASDIILDAALFLLNLHEIKDDDNIAVLLLIQSKTINILLNKIAQNTWNSKSQFRAALLVAEYRNFLKKNMIPNFQEYEVSSNVIPPVVNENSGPLIAGMNPMNIADSLTRKKYEAAIAENNQRSRINKTQHFYDQVYRGGEPSFLGILKRIIKKNCGTDAYVEVLKKAGYSDVEIQKLLNAEE